MFTKSDFLDAIFKGLSNACTDAYLFTGEVNAKITPEYIVTANVAKSLFTMNNGNIGYGHDLIIKCEEETEVFALSCVPQMKATDLFNIYVRGYQNTERNGNIDIAVYNDSENPICPIEVKDFNPSKGEVLKDLERNLQLLQLEDENTGSSKLEFTFVALLEEHKNCLHEANKNSGLKTIRENYEKKLESFKSSLNNYELTVETRTVAENLLDAQTNFDGRDSMDVYEIIKEKYHFVGVILILEKKTKALTLITNLPQ